MKDYLDSNDTAYLEYHSWRNMSPSEDEDDMPFYGTRTTQMSCDLCKGRFQTLFRDIFKVPNQKMVNHIDRITWTYIFFLKIAKFS